MIFVITVFVIDLLITGAVAKWAIFAPVFIPLFMRLGGEPDLVLAAYRVGLSAQPVLMSLNVGASAAFLTPVATPSNLIVMVPGGYRFGDYWKLGLALIALYFSAAVFWVPVVWPL